MERKLSLHTETFGFEKRWIVKALRYLEKSDDLFAHKENQRILGIGPNKIKALNIWLKGFELIVSSKNSSKLTGISKIIMECDGYLDEYGTWIVLIDNISISPPHNPASLYWYLNIFGRTRFTRNELKEDLFRSELFNHLSNTSKEKGLQGLVSTLKNPIISEELELFQEIGNDNFRKGYPLKDFMHPLVFAYCIVNWAERNGNKDIIQISDLVNRKGLPGRIFNLSEKYILEKLSDLDIRYSKKILNLERFAGLDRVYLKELNKLKILQLFYEEVITRKPIADIVKSLK